MKPYRDQNDPAVKLERHEKRIVNLERRSCGPWIYPSDDADFPYQGDWEDISSRKRSRYRMLLGGGLEVQVNAIGGTAGSDIFPLRTGFWDPEQDPEGSGHDTSGNYRAWHIDGTRGMVVDGVGA